MQIPRSVFLTVLLATAACRPGAEDGSLLFGLSEEEIMVRAYDHTDRVPAGFYVDERSGTPGSYTIHHVKDPSLSFELCSDDFLEASAWEEADNASRAVNGLLVGTFDNERYFEFVRELEYDDGVGNIDEPTSPGFARVFKCQYVDRYGVDANLRNGFAGVLNAGVTEESVATLTEYLWQFRFFWPAEPTVLRSFSEADEHTVRHTLLLALLTRQGDARCDLIEVVAWTFTANRSDGELTRDFSRLSRFEADWRNGAPTRC